MLRPIDSYFENHPEPIKSYLASLRILILKSDIHVTESWKYRMPFYCYNGKMFCYLWVRKENRYPYLGIVEGKNVNHPKLQKEKRARMKILIVNPEKDLPIRTIQIILKAALNLYRT